MKIPYTLVSMAAILRDYVDMSDAYKNTEHKRLVDIADSLYNVGMDPDEFLPAYKELYFQYGKPYFDQVLDDMYALDSQLTSDVKVQELLDDYNDRLNNITASIKVTASTDSLKYTAFFNEDILDVFDTYDEAVSVLKSEIKDAIAAGDVELIDFENCWVETDDGDAEVMYCADTDDEFREYINVGEPLTEAQVKELWDTTAMYVDFGSRNGDALLQENDYTLDQALEFLRQGYPIYVDASTKVRSNYIKAGSGEYWRDFKISGLRNVLRRFDSNGSSAKSGHWYIGNGGYDLDWELYYDNQPVIDCINGRLENVCLPSAVWNKISQVIISEYPDVTL